MEPWFKATCNDWEGLTETFPRVWPYRARMIDLAYWDNRVKMGWTKQLPTQRELGSRWGCSRWAVSATIKSWNNTRRTSDAPSVLHKNEAKPARSLDSRSAPRSSDAPLAHLSRSKKATQRAHEEEKRKEPLYLKDKGFLSTDIVKEKQGGEPTPLRGPNPLTRIEIGSVEEGKRFLLDHKEQLKVYRGDREGAIGYFQSQTKSATTVIKALSEFGGWSWL